MFVLYCKNKQQGMDRNILHKFYKGLASGAEKEAIKEWLESNPRHEAEFLNEREFLNAALFAAGHPDFGRQAAAKKTFSLRSLALELLKITAAVALTLAAGFYFHTKKM